MLFSEGDENETRTLKRKVRPIYKTSETGIKKSNVDSNTFINAGNNEEKY